MATLQNIIRITKSDFDTLVSDGQITKGGVTYSYSPDTTLYVIDNGLDENYVQLGDGGGKPLSDFATHTEFENLRSNLANETAARKSQAATAYLTCDGTNAVLSKTIWQEIHAETPTVVSEAASITLSTAGAHKYIVNLSSGEAAFTLPTLPADGETFVLIKCTSGCTLKIVCTSADMFFCTTGASLSTATVSSSNRRRVTLTYSSAMGKWLLMADDFLGI